MPKQIDPTSPDFPHGDSGYNRGCRKTSPCPVTPTCTERHRVKQQAYRARAAKQQQSTADDGGRLTSYLQRRVRKSLTVTDLPGLAEASGLTVRIIEGVLAAEGLRTPEHIAAPLDHAWALLVHGQDVSTFTEHGIESYKKFCRCATCGAAGTRTRKAWGVGHRTNLAYVEDPTLGAHVRSLLRYVSASHIGEVAGGIDYKVIHRIADGQTRVRVRTRTALRALTPANVVDALPDTAQIDSGPVNLLLGQLWALGYSTNRINRALGFNRAWRPERKVTVRIARQITAFHASIGDTPAPVTAEYPLESVNGAKNRARRAGFYPPAFYNENGELEVRAIADHPWTRADDAAGRRLHALRLVLAGDLSHTAIARECNLTSRTVQRATKRLGLSYVHTLTDGEVLDRRKCRDAIRRIEDALHDYEHRGVGPITTCFTLGILSPEAGIPHDHPEYVAWLADKDVAA